MFTLLVISAFLCAAAGPPASGEAIVVPRFKSATLPEGALARLGGDRFTLLRPLQAVEFAADGKELQGWDGHTLHRWEFPSGRPLERVSVPRAVNPSGHPFGYTALSPHHPQVAWIRFHDNKERLQIWDFQKKKLVLDHDITLDNKDLDYMGLAWSDDATNLLAVINDKRVHVYDLEGKLVEKSRVTDGRDGFVFPAGKRWHNSGYIRKGVVAHIGKSRIRIATAYSERKLKRDQYPAELLTFTDLDSGKTQSIEPSPELIRPGHAALSKDGKHLALIDNNHLRIWDVLKRREMDLGHAFPEMAQMVVSPGGAFVQFQREWIRFQGQPWHSLKIDDARQRLLEPREDTTGITLGLGAMRFAVGKGQFVGITARSVDRWDLKTGRSLEGMALPKTPSEMENSVGYDECLLLGDGFKMAQFACIVKKDGKKDDEFRPTWRLWSPGMKDPPLRPLPDCTWQRGAAALPQGRFLYFATPTASASSRDKEVQPGVTLRLRGETQMYFGQLDRPDVYRPAAFSGTWSELRGASRRGHLLLLSTSGSTWIQTTRGSSSTWTDPAAYVHALQEFHSGQPAGDGKKLAAVVRDHASLLSHDGRFLVVAGENKLLLYEPHVLGKVVKEIPLPATPKRFAASEDGTRIACQLDDATLMMWDGGRLARLVDVAVAREIPRDLNGLVGDLAKNPTAALRAARLLAAAGEPGVAALRKAIDGRPPDGKQVAGWIRDLDSDESATRDKAESSLAAWGLPIEKTLREEMDARPSAEKRLRLLRLLSRFTRGPYGNRELAQARAVLSLDWNASPAAAKLLAEWADKYPKSVLGSESKFALVARH